MKKSGRCPRASVCAAADLTALSCPPPFLAVNVDVFPAAIRTEEVSRSLKYSSLAARSHSGCGSGRSGRATVPAYSINHSASHKMMPPKQAEPVSRPITGTVTLARPLAASARC